MNFITNHWSEVTLMLFVIIAGAKYLIKTYFDLSIKKTEIIFDKVKQQKLIELKNFFACFNELNRSLIVYSRMVNQNDKKFSSNIENKLVDDWNSFKISIFYLNLFLSNEEIRILNELEKELFEVNRTLHLYGFDDPSTFKGEDYEAKLKN